MRILDPCCGEGTALAEVKHHLTECGATVEALGVEFDAERAWHAKGLLDTVAHSDVADVFVTARSVGLLFLNPPYGHTVADRAGTSERAKGDRLEKVFCRKTFPWLKLGGVLVLILPHYRAGCGVRGTDRPELRPGAGVHGAGAAFPAVRDPRGQAPVRPARSQGGRDAGGGGPWENFPRPCRSSGRRNPTWSPVWRKARSSPSGRCAWMPPSWKRSWAAWRAHTLWPRFPAMFSTAQTPNRPPLRAMSRWHLALALAAGQIGGVIRSRTGRTLLIKGDTFKEKETHVEYEERRDGTVAETRILTDRFVPVIRAIDLTPGPGYGDIVTIS